MQRRLEPVRFQFHRTQAPRQITRLRNRLIHHRGDSLRVIRFRQLFLSQLRAQNFHHAGDARQILPKPIVQILSDAPLFAFADSLQFALEAFAFGNINCRPPNHRLLALLI